MRLFAPFLAFVVLFSCGDDKEPSGTDTATSTTTGTPELPDFTTTRPGPGPDFVDCNIGADCSIPNLKCDGALVCGNLGPGISEEDEKECGVPCEHSDQCFEGFCSVQVGLPPPHICVDSLSGFSYFATNLCPGTPACGGDECVEKCELGLTCVGGKCALPCEDFKDCPCWDQFDTPTPSPQCECEGGACKANGYFEDNCYPSV